MLGLDPATLEVLDRVDGFSRPESVAVGHGAIWVIDIDRGLVRIDVEETSEIETVEGSYIDEVAVDDEGV